MKTKELKPLVLTPEQGAEAENLMRCCEAAALALTQRLDREEEEAGSATGEPDFSWPSLTYSDR